MNRYKIHSEFRTPFLYPDRHPRTQYILIDADHDGNPLANLSHWYDDQATVETLREMRLSSDRLAGISSTAV